MNRLIEPFYFTAEDRSLFGLYHPPRGPARGEGIVICYPAPQEMMRSYQAHVQLASLLAEIGYAVLRFDYSGTGDSAGESSLGSLRNWEADTIAAFTFFRKKASVQRISIIGTRLGATLALRASCHVGPKQLLLWDPVIDGQAYLKALQDSHERMLHRNPLEPPFAGGSYSQEQCWGFPFPASFQKEIAAIDILEARTFCKQVHLVSSETLSPGLAEQLRSSSETQVSEHLLREAMHWIDERFVKRRAFPKENLQTIKKILEAA